MSECRKSIQDEFNQKGKPIMKRLVVMTSIIGVVMLVGCSNNKSNPVNSPTTNIPVITSVNNAFTFNLTAVSYTGAQQYTMSFTTDTIACALTVTGQTAGSGSLIVADSNYATVYADSVLSNQVVAFTQSGKGIPKRISMAFNGYTGTVVFTLARGSSGH